MSKNLVPGTPGTGSPGLTDAASASDLNDQLCQPRNPIYKLPDKYTGTHFWSANASNHEVLYNFLLPSILEAIGDGSVENTEDPFVVCDYGAGDGGTSMKLMAEIISIRKKHGEEKPIVIVYEDQPWNDFKSLFCLSQGLFGDQTSFLPEDENVFVLASGTNFFTRCLPRNYVDLAVSCCAMHWLSKRPCSLAQDIFCRGDLNSEEELEAYKKQAAQDWETILLNRTAELKPGAHFFLVTSASKDGMHSGATRHYTFRITTYLKDLWLTFAKTGRITMEEFVNTNVAYFQRTEDELKAPFLSADSKVSASGFKLMSLEINETIFDISMQLKNKKLLDEEQRVIAHYARKYVNALRGWINAVFMSGLDGRRSKEEKMAIVDNLFSQLEDDVACRPNDFGYDMIVAYIDILKEK
ncbi:probable S-adenosylmethionine-dependent methyltransferase At5g38100 isoform X2 [Lingula anatina]|uniref:Probable S-adenosylmethionine-dependent methyltransferase At5g38100 isoform X2 n=1 Tax=Lingula anatina TaxID=7574 RepID=A0A2R2MT61_LINAN|nr:probable S-adenosylmethionine-dependent methyltransferase At5g38100 isoform X2 [Lingula anatina]|eukprot:XP_023933439.1 probable S-adenosylmethionine-dependent methyltransferase At5g38100 isoform X2 [Lingula anatina]